MAKAKTRLKARQKLAHYRIVRWLASGGYAEVYHAVDTIMGIHCALKIPHPHLIDDETLEDFRREVRFTARLDHSNVLPILSAFFHDERFVIVSPLGEGTLSERLRTRLSPRIAILYAEQILEALACAHQKRIIHCDVTPDNFILFPNQRLKLTDFGIAKTMLRKVSGSGRGTVGYLAPEQAMGKPSFRSDLFSAGLIIYRMFSGRLPEWPYEWPLPGERRLRRILSSDMVNLIRRTLEVDARKRFPDAGATLGAFRRIRNRALIGNGGRGPDVGSGRAAAKDWKVIRQKQFLRRFGTTLESRHRCTRCGNPVAEAMSHCPWCGTNRKSHRGKHRFPAQCPRCRRGLKLDWRYCPWCYGAGVGPLTNRSYSDKRYTAKCSNPECVEKDQMPFMRYCPWCNQKVKRAWKIKNSKESCPRCKWGIVRDYWHSCPWCSTRLSK